MQPYPRSMVGIQPSSSDGNARIEPYVAFEPRRVAMAASRHHDETGVPSRLDRSLHTVDTHGRYARSTGTISSESP